MASRQRGRRDCSPRSQPLSLLRSQLPLHRGAKVGATTTYTYDANNRLIEEVSNKTGTNVLISYTYDDNGNLLSQLDVDNTAIVRHTYDGFNQLVSSVTGEGTITYTYNAQGIRTSRTVGLVTTHYLLDGGNVIGEVTGDETYTYVRGINLIFGRARYYLYNAHGDVVQLTNTNGELTRNYNYDAFGNERDPDEEDGNPFRYCGEYYDTETGLYYLRARYYDPLIGRFTQEDTHWNTANMIYGDNPQKINEREDALGLKHYSYAPQLSAVVQSGNLYVYTANNPVRYKDPSGALIWPGEIHQAVILYIITHYEGYDFYTEQWIIYPKQIEMRGKKYDRGRADLINKLNSEFAEVWEVKPNKPRHIKAGTKQLENYVNGIWVQFEAIELISGGQIAGATFTYTDQNGTKYTVKFECQGGLILYDYWEQVRPTEVQTISVPNSSYIVMGVGTLMAMAIFGMEAIKNRRTS